MTQDTIAEPVTLPVGTYVAIVECAVPGVITASDIRDGLLAVKVIQRKGTTNNFKFHCLHGGWEGTFNEGIVRTNRQMVGNKAKVAWQGARSSLPSLNNGQDVDHNDVYEAVKRAALGLE